MSQPFKNLSLTLLCIAIVGLQFVYSQVSQSYFTSPLDEKQHKLNIEDVTLLVVQQVDSGNYENVKQILEFGISPNIDWYGTTPLMYAAQRGHYEIARELMIYGAELDTPNPEGLTALHFATSNHKDSIAELLVLNGANPHPINSQGVSPLHYASAYGYPYMAYLLLSYGAHIDSADYSGNTPLMASVYSGALEAADYLLENWADVDKPDNNGITPLMVAAQFNDTTMMRLLTDYGADIDKRDNKGITALAVAIANKSEEAAIFLLEQKASLHNLPPEMSYADLANRNGLKELALTLNGLGSPLSKKIEVHYVAPYVKTTINSNDFFMAIGANTTLLPYGISLGIDIGIRPYTKAIVIEDTYATYQFFERRNIASVSIAKELAQSTTRKKSVVSFSLGVKGITSWGKFNVESSVYKAKTYHLITPEIRWTLARNWFYLSTSFHLLTMDHLKESPLSFSITTGFIIDPTKSKVKKKKIDWY
ncbi:MAG: ankyrin repeat domain-containing protein [Bacteroidales bacterium]|nr:ankyrin repeat domain-containing protein [Bacteroidales bacterium]